MGRSIAVAVEAAGTEVSISIISDKAAEVGKSTKDKGDIRLILPATLGVIDNR